MADAKPARWEQVADAMAKTVIIDENQSGSASEPVIFAIDGYIYVYLPEASQVSVINILGHPIDETHLDRGTYRLRLPSRGIYIVKTPGKIVRITL